MEIDDAFRPVADKAFSLNILESAEDRFETHSVIFSWR